MGHSEHCLTASTLQNIRRYSSFSFFIVYTQNGTLNQIDISGSEHTSSHSASFQAHINPRLKSFSVIVVYLCANITVKEMRSSQGFVY